MKTPRNGLTSLLYATISGVICQTFFVTVSFVTPQVGVACYHLRMDNKCAKVHREGKVLYAAA